MRHYPSAFRRYQRALPPAAFVQLCETLLAALGQVTPDAISAAWPVAADTGSVTLAARRTSNHGVGQTRCIAASRWQCGRKPMLHALAVALLVASVSSTPPAAHGVIRMTVVPVGGRCERRAAPRTARSHPPRRHYRRCAERGAAGASQCIGKGERLRIGRRVDETAPVFSAEYLNPPRFTQRLSRARLGEQERCCCACG